MTEEISWKFPIVVAELPDAGREYELAPDKATRDALARHAGVLAVPAFVAHLHVRKEGSGGAVVEGKLRATVTQECVVTLDPFDNAIEETIALHFAPADAIGVEPDGLVAFGEDEPPDPLVGGMLDLAAVVTEFFTLAIDPYPRKPGAVFTPPPVSEAEEEASAFAALEKLKSRGNGEKS